MLKPHVVKMAWNPLHFKSKKKLHQSFTEENASGPSSDHFNYQIILVGQQKYLKSLEDWMTMPDSKAFKSRLRLSRKKPICRESFL